MHQKMCTISARDVGHDAQAGNINTEEITAWAPTSARQSFFFIQNIG